MSELDTIHKAYSYGYRVALRWLLSQIESGISLAELKSDAEKALEEIARQCPEVLSLEVKRSDD